MPKSMQSIKNFPGYYITEDGNVYSSKYGDLRLLKPSTNLRGYLNVILRKNGKSVNHRVHRLVAEAYVSNPNNDLEVDHIDRNKLNNNANNLRWVSRSENLKNRGSFSYSDEFKEKMRMLAYQRPRAKDGTFFK